MGQYTCSYAIDAHFLSTIVFAQDEAITTWEVLGSRQCLCQHEQSKPTVLELVPPQALPNCEGISIRVDRTLKS